MVVPQTQRACRNIPNAALKFVVSVTRAPDRRRAATEAPERANRRRPVDKAVSTRRTKTLTYNNYI